MATRQRPGVSPAFVKNKRCGSSPLVGRLRALEVLLLNPGHQAAEAGAGLLDRVLLAFLEQGVVLLVAALVFLHPLLGKLAGLDVLESRLHALLYAGVDDLRSDGNIAPLGGLGDRETH